MSDMERLRSELFEISKLGSAVAVLGWDEEVNLPPKAHGFRGEVKALLTAQVHERITDPEFVKMVKQLARPENLKNLTADEQVTVRETWRDVSHAAKLPVSFVEQMAKLTTEAFEAWTDARKQSNFNKFAPYLEKILAMKREEAELLGYKGSPYDALIDTFEPEMTSARLESLFKPLAVSLAELIKHSPPPAKLPRTTYPLAAQVALGREVAEALGYDLSAGRIDVSAHPFTTDFHPTDVRITTRYDEHDFWAGLAAIIHEVGHALYEQGLPAKHFGTPLGESVSLGVHESQSRIWENFVGRSREFTGWLHPLMVKHFGSQNIKFTADELHAWLNRVEPGLIRIEADEITYNLHIILRFELEKALIEGKLKVKELPAAWNQKVKDYLGLKVPNDGLGVLQDVHWSHGYFGYFPTYSLGNIYAAQLYRAALKAIPNLEKAFAKGDFKPFLAWLRKNIHIHGRRLPAEQLIKQATGEPLNPQYLQQHLAAKIK